MFLAPLVNCNKPAAAKTKFFDSLPALKTAVHALAAPLGVSEADATAVVETVAAAMDRAAQAGMPS